MDLTKLVGKTEIAAKKAIEDAGLSSRVECKDGEQYMLTMDHNPCRVNLTISKGKVVSTRLG